MEKMVFIWIVIVSSSFGAEFSINEGVYLMPKCFFKITEEDDLIYIQFAHENQHLEESDYNEDREFHPDNVLGTNVIFDKKDNSVVFGPDKCGVGNIKKIRSTSSENKWVISCGGKFSSVYTKLTIFTDKNHRLKKFRFKESFNSSTRRTVSWPWNRKKLYHFSCSGLRLEKL